MRTKTIISIRACRSVVFHPVEDAFVLSQTLFCWSRIVLGNLARKTCILRQQLSSFNGQNVWKQREVRSSAILRTEPAIVFHTTHTYHNHLKCTKAITRYFIRLSCQAFKQYALYYIHYRAPAFRVNVSKKPKYG